MRYKGIAYPFMKHPKGFFHNSASDVAQIKSNIAAIILTEPEERIFVPYFGTPLKTVNLNQPMELVKADMRVRIATAIKKWEKRVQVHDITVDLAMNDDRLIANINVLFLDPINVRNVESLVVYKSLGGMNGKLMSF